jgi:CxxC-x17-CxxC domain-containing protein
MEFQDRTLTCSDCGNAFVFTAGEQSFYQEKGFAHEPRRCKDCRSRKKGESGGGGGGSYSRGSGGGARSDTGDRQTFTAVCSACGGPAKINFQPDPNRPVFCRTCFQSRQADRQYR